MPLLSLFAQPRADNNISAAGVAEITRALASNTTLTELERSAQDHHTFLFASHASSGDDEIDAAVLANKERCKITAFCRGVHSGDDGGDEENSGGCALSLLARFPHVVEYTALASLPAWHRLTLDERKSFVMRMM